MGEQAEREFPRTFYFNGAIMPKWGACWPELPRPNYENWDWEVGPRDLYTIRSKIDVVGRVESANAHSFIYAVQELLCLLFTETRMTKQHCERLAARGASAEEIFDHLVEAAFQMRELARRDGVAMWTSGNETERLKLADAIRRAALPSKDPEHQPPPHILSRANHLQFLWKNQSKTLHQVAAGKNIPPAWRDKLMEL